MVPQAPFTQAGDGVAPGGDGDQTGQGGVEAHGHVRLAVLAPGQGHAHHGSNGGSQGGGGEDLGQLVDGTGGCAVEAVPAEPENKYAKGTDQQVVTENRLRLAVLVIFSNTRSQHCRTDESSDTANHMDAGRAREICKSHVGQPRCTAPYPVSFNRVHT